MDVVEYFKEKSNTKRPNKNLFSNMKKEIVSLIVLMLEQGNAFESERNQSSMIYNYSRNKQSYTRDCNKKQEQYKCIMRNYKTIPSSSLQRKSHAEDKGH